MKNLSIVVFIFLVSNLFANNQYTFLQVNNSTGLVNNQVNCIYKDQKGFIWIGTTAGLSRYDGANFVNYQHQASDSTSIIENYIGEIQEDKDGYLWIKTQHNYILFNQQNETFYNDISHVLGDELSKSVEHVYIDLKRDVWIKYYDKKHYHKFNSETGKLQEFIMSNYNDESRVIDFVHVENVYYCLFSNGVVEAFDDHTFKSVLLNYDLSTQFGISDIQGTSIFIDKDRDIWFYGNNNGVMHFIERERRWEHYTRESGEVTSNFIDKVNQDGKGSLWFGMNNGGIDIFNKHTLLTQNIQNEAYNEKSLAHNSITELYVDNNNIVWVGTYKNGVSYYHESIHKFKHYKNIPSNKSSLPYNDVNCFVEDKKGNLWIGTNGGGLLYYNREDETYEQYLHNEDDSKSLSSDVIVSLFIDNNETLWIGTFTGGLNSFNGTNFNQHECVVDEKLGTINNNIWSINQDDSGDLWIGTLGGGVVLYNIDKKTFTPLSNKGEIEASVLYVNRIFKMKNGDMFIATADGAFCYDILAKRFKYQPDISADECIQLSNRNVNDIYEDSRGLLWIATREGLTVFNPFTKQHKLFIEKDGLSEDIFNCIQEDEFNTIWVSRSNGLSQIAVSKALQGNDYQFNCINYSEKDGVQGKQFNVNASCKTRNNEIIFGGLHGFNLINTKDVIYNIVLPKVVFTDFKIHNRSIEPGSPIGHKILLDQSITSTQNIKLKNSMNSFTIDFTALDFFIPSKVQYKYKLEGFSDHWITLDSRRHSVTYTNLHPGEYTFAVKASNNDGVWSTNNTTLNIKVLPPFYATIFAYCFYFVLLVCSFILLRRYTLKKERHKFLAEQERVENEKNQEVEEMKLRFLTNISHEFRTPLTLILTPLAKLKRDVNTTNDKKLIDIIDRNAKQLLELVNQLLDFRKLDLQGLNYHPRPGDLVPFLQESIQNFEDAFEKKNISYCVEHDVDCFILNFDQEKLQKVMMNLLSNALKFTKENGAVKVCLSVVDADHMVKITVEDNGHGIDPKEIDKVFNRFFQSEHNQKLGLSGSGIGLNLASEMVQLHGGTIDVESTYGSGAKFTVSIPFDGEENNTFSVVECNDYQNQVASTEQEQSSKNKKPVVVLVEDNIDFRSFMKETLDARYTVHEAADGQLGFDLVQKVLPDLIISDIMMPNIDGLELCKMLRADIKTSHIPIVLLTARTTDEYKIKGLEIGADDYITKPFNMDLLLLRVHKLMEKRSNFHKKFQQNIDIQPNDIQITSMDEKLIKNAIAIVERNIAEPKFTVEAFSQEMNMSRVYLYKKLTSITGKSPIEFIRIIRLRRGAKLLEQSQLNIAEIAYQVGFNSPRYFSKYFKEEYGMLPTAYVKANNEKKAGVTSI